MSARGETAPARHRRKEHSHGAADGERRHNCRESGARVRKIVDAPPCVEGGAAAALEVGAAADGKDARMGQESGKQAGHKRRVDGNIAVDEDDHVAGDGCCSRAETGGTSQSMDKRCVRTKQLVAANTDTGLTLLSAQGCRTDLTCRRQTANAREAVLQPMLQSLHHLQTPALRAGATGTASSQLRTGVGGGERVACAGRASHAQSSALGRRENRKGAERR